ncbi:serine threonine-protein kinase putative [Entamoeba histolytica]|uniref:Serine/threonine-protein kinase, putative n=2 Tax=Entamoeba histolytica TaxID=5759 RepID=C4M268_ENTH1|nr:serine/threonine-protein kinase, putative [Entamoeba histolytica HM-1:IMSS]EAL47115.2 serine/threonine-protein kinase, putative [Entamoeba histolytica HM-1:IMSS]GAT95360.1 serine threonine-protein kinase putative [Entamoeba histolytica]|eukprot:XP_652502.2 serine/threonine-protein kinase, putative [Entamoeba histolytica HM-1:IMSS]
MALASIHSAFCPIDRTALIFSYTRRPFSILKAQTTRLISTYVHISPNFHCLDIPTLILTEPKTPMHNYGLDNSNYELIVRVGDILGTSTSFEGKEYSMNPNVITQYKVISKLGQGTFGQVFKCKDLQHDREVAIKILKNKKAYFRQGMLEITALLLLNKFYDTKKQIVEILDHFLYCNHLCIVTELLGSSLYELMKLNKKSGFSLPTIQTLNKQILECLVVCKQACIIHCDIKPENILLTGISSKLKLIDLGSCCFDNYSLYSYIQSRFYRAPEVCIGYRYNCAIDMWSFGCMVAEMFFGIPLFVANSELGLLRKQIKFLGMLPAEMLINGTKTENYFNRYDHLDGTVEYILKDDEEFEEEYCVELPEEKDYFKKKSLKELVYLHNIILDVSKIPVDPATLRLTLFDFLSKCLTYKPEDRLTPQEALAHPLFNAKLKSEKDIKKKVKVPKVPNLQLKTPKKRHNKKKEDRLQELGYNSNRINTNSPLDYYKAFLKQLEQGHIPLITEESPFEEEMTPENLSLVFQKERMIPQTKIEKQCHTPRRIRAVSFDGQTINKPIHRSRSKSCGHSGSLGTIEATESKSKKKSYKIPTLNKVNGDDSGSSMSSSSSSELSNSTGSSPRRRIFSVISPRKTESPQESPRSSTKLSFLIPSFMRKRSNSSSGRSSDNEGSIVESSKKIEK